MATATPNWTTATNGISNNSISNNMALCFSARAYCLITPLVCRRTYRVQHRRDAHPPTRPRIRVLLFLSATLPVANDNRRRQQKDDYLDACLVTCLQIHEEEKGDGDVLVFLPGQDDIESLSQLLRENLAKLRAEKSR